MKEVKPLCFVITGMRNIGQRESHWEHNPDYERVKHGPDYVSVQLRPNQEADEDEGKTELKLIITQKVAKRFRLGAIVELWPMKGPVAQQKRKEIAELKAMMKN